MNSPSPVVVDCVRDLLKVDQPTKVNVLVKVDERIAV
jgi:hypothetical protein